MKKPTIIFLALLLSIWSCENNVSDTDLLGSYLDIKAGDSYEVCYQKLQYLYTNGQINSMYVDNVTFNTIDKLNEEIELYNEFEIREKSENNVGDRIAVYFDSDTLQFLLNLDIINPLTAGPTHLTNWPEDSESNNVIRIGDSKEIIKGKFTKLLEEGLLTTKMSSIGFILKDLNTPFDNYSKNSSSWTILKSYTETDNIRTYFIIRFGNGVVHGIEILEVTVIELN